LRSTLAGRARRLSILVAAATVAGSLLFAGAGTVLAAKQPKVTVCHYDKTLDIYVALSVAEASKHLAHGDTLADGRLAGKTVYALAYTNADGIAGYSACGDNLIGAIVEASGDGVPSAGDKVLFGQFPTAFSAPYGFTSFPATEATLTGISACDASSLVGDVLGAQAAFVHTASVDGFGWGYVQEFTNPFVLLLDQSGGGSASEFSDLIVADIGTTDLELAEGANGTNADPFVDVWVSGVCNS
jgi:hypothetical protein